MFRWMFVFFIAALVSSVFGQILPEGSMLLAVSKAVFGLAFVLFAAALLRDAYLNRNTLGKGRTLMSGPIRPVRLFGRAATGGPAPSGPC